MKFLNLSMLFVLLVLSASFNYEQTEKISIKSLTEEALDKIIKERGNKPLLINIWATWCVPCREEFPDLVKLAVQYKDKADFIGISVDEEDEIESKVKPFLNNFNVNFDIYLNAFDDAQDFINYFDKDWNGAIPATFIYNAQGKKASTIIGKEDYNFFESELKKTF
ncbi:MAG: TlpA disulfide reductase family protein [Ignavibacteriaceae bacterium]